MYEVLSLDSKRGSAANLGFEPLEIDEIKCLFRNDTPSIKEKPPIFVAIYSIHMYVNYFHFTKKINIESVDFSLNYLIDQLCTVSAESSHVY